MNTKFASIEEYINSFPELVQSLLMQMHDVIKQNAHGASESIAYGMPAFKLRGKPLVYFAGYEKHIGFYATPNGHEAFAQQLSAYKQGKGSVQFPIDKPLPLELVAQIVEYRVRQITLLK
jgi:uncharacterized protein YdhG (YjbR/CyaY superfamily)